MNKTLKEKKLSKTDEKPEPQTALHKKEAYEKREKLRDKKPFREPHKKIIQKIGGKVRVRKP